MLKFRLETFTVKGKRENPDHWLFYQLEVISPYAGAFSDPITSHGVDSNKYVALLGHNQRLCKVPRGRVRGKVWAALNGRESPVVWLYGAPQSGKTTLLMELTRHIRNKEPFWIPVRVHVTRRAGARLCELMWEVDEALYEAMKPLAELSIQEPDKYFCDPYLIWSNAFHTQLDNYLQAHNQSLLLMWDGFYHLGSPDSYQALFGLANGVGEGNLQRVRLLVTDVVHFDERLQRVRDETHYPPEELIRGNVFIQNVSIGQFSLRETEFLLRRPFGGQFPARNLDGRRLEHLRRISAGHPSILKSVLHQSSWLFDEGAPDGGFKVPEDAVERLLDQYNRLNVLTPEEQKLLGLLSRSPKPMMLCDLVPRTGRRLEALKGNAQSLISKGLVERLTGNPPSFKANWANSWLGEGD